MILILYVDDMILNEPHLDKIADFKWELQQSFAVIDLGQLHYFLGIQFARIEGGYCNVTIQVYWVALL